jgi:hypothetical protein
MDAFFRFFIVLFVLFVFKVIWTHELTFPKLISNDGSLFVKNDRFSLLPVELSLNNRKNTAVDGDNEEYSIRIKKHYDLKICPLKVTDSGWYSCYVVKKDHLNSNIKYFTFLNVLQSDEHGLDNESYDDNYDYNSEMSKCKYDKQIDDGLSQFNSLNDDNKGRREKRLV